MTECDLGCTTAKGVVGEWEVGVRGTRGMKWPVNRLQECGCASTTGQG